MTAIGFIGAGQLGEPMVRRLIAAGHRIAVYARRDDVRARLSDAGAELAGSPAELAAGSDVLISCLFSDEQLRDTAFGARGFAEHLPADSIFVSHTTGSVDVLREVARTSSAAILDAPVSGTAEDISLGALTVLIGGPASPVDRVRSVLAAYADPVIATGEFGSAMTVKLVNNVLFAANAQLVSAAVRAGERLGVAQEALLDALAVCSGHSAAAAYVRGMGGVEEFAARAMPFLRKDVAAAVAAAESVGADISFLASVVASGPMDLG